jgi:hypothetical protein
MTRPVPLPGDADHPEQICAFLRFLIAAVCLVLIDQTRSLWFGSPDVFPHVPLVKWCVSWPIWWDRLASWLMVLSLASLLFFPAGGRMTSVASWIFAGAFLLAVLLNQHRLQPWAFEFCVLMLILALLPPKHAVTCLRFFVASIYLHSGLSKLDVTFLTTHGESFVSVITNAIGWNLSEAPKAIRQIVVATLPVGEIAVAVGLSLPKTRRIAKWCSVVMHLLLIWILGPWGLDHHAGVLIWNGFFILQNLILFQNVVLEKPDESSRSAQRTKLLGYALTALVVFLPFLEPFGLYDHWPAWAVYASRPERTRVYISEDRIAEMPLELRGVVSDEPGPEAAERFLAGKPAWRRVRIDRWSLDVLHAPIYPQDRFQVGVALWLAEEYGLGEDIRVEIDSAADRFTGERTIRIIEGTEALREAAGEYDFNVLPR